MTTAPSNNGRVNPIVIIAMTVIACIALIVAGGLILAGKGVNDLLAVFGLIVVPLLGIFGAHIYTKLDDIKTISNGNNAAMRDALIQALQTFQSQATPPAVVVVKPALPADQSSDQTTAAGQ